MRYLLPTLVFAVFAFSLASCEEENADVTSSVNKDGSVETAVQITHVDSTHDLLITTHKVWVRNSEYKTVQYHDTIPALGSAWQTAENEDGDEKQVNVKKEYEIYITVK